MNATDRVLYFDTSALAPLYIPEVFSRGADEAVRSEGLRCVSSLGLTEFSAAARAKCLRGELSAEDAQSAYSVFREHVEVGLFDGVVVEERDHRSARDLPWRVIVAVRALGAIHVAVADRLGAVMVSADERLLSMACEVGLEVIDIRAVSEL